MTLYVNYSQIQKMDYKPILYTTVLITIVENENQISKKAFNGILMACRYIGRVSSLNKSKHDLTL